ncbi:MAG: serine hydrolase [Acidobacteria bacterium]|nr:serine hydrolase [Acidobacteriota bacterium]
MRGSAARVSEFLRERVAAGDFPGACYLVAEGDRILAEGAFGHAVVAPEKIPATVETIWDLASLSKPLAGALIAALLRAEGALRLEDPLARHLPAWRVEDEREGITLLDLLTHRSGLPAWHPLYLHAAGGDRKGRIAWLRGAAPASGPGKTVVYSDLGYILLGFALERIGGAPLDRLFDDRVARPLRLADLSYRPGPEKRRRIAATEDGNARERSLAGPEGDRYNGWRSGMIWGEVHDNNAHTLGGVSANAGLFGAARAVYLLARELIGSGTGLLGEEGRSPLRTNLTAGGGEDRSAGFQMASSPGCSAGAALSRSAFGHTGFTGTSLWIDPETRRVYVLLTNRVHPRFRDIDMNAIRRAFHEVAAAL